jgi:hypothetical protein
VKSNLKVIFDDGLAHNAKKPLKALVTRISRKSFDLDLLCRHAQGITCLP